MPNYLGVMLGKKHSTETKLKMSRSAKGKPKSVEARKKMSERMKRDWRLGIAPGFKKGNQAGKLISVAGRKRISDALKRRADKRGRKIYKRYYHFCASREYKEWRMAVFLRDNFTCQACNTRGYIEAHHIRSWAEYPELRYEVNNGVALCKECHVLTRKIKLF